MLDAAGNAITAKQRIKIGHDNGAVAIGRVFGTGFDSAHFITANAAHAGSKIQFGAVVADGLSLYGAGNLMLLIK